MIPKRFIRIWVGGKIEIPEMFQDWWNQFQEMHPDWEFVTIENLDQLEIPENLIEIIKHVSEHGTCAGLSDILRIVSVYCLGGVYIDTDIMPLKSFEPLIKTENLFLGKRSQKSFESAVIGGAKGHKALRKLIEKMPQYYWDNLDRSASVQTGPVFVSKFLFGRDDVDHLPIRYFYPYNGFMSPSEGEKNVLFSNKMNFPSMMYCAHYSISRWGGKPNAIKKII